MKTGSYVIKNGDGMYVVDVRHSPLNLVLSLSLGRAKIFPFLHDAEKYAQHIGASAKVYEICLEETILVVSKEE